MTKKPVPKAKIKFCKFENAIAMQVIYMDERFRCDKNTDIIYQADPMTICSGNKPAFYKRSINLWGRHYGDNFPVICYTETNNDVDLIMNRAISSLKDWAQNWEGWNDEPAIEPVIKEYEGGVVYVEV